MGIQISETNLSYLLFLFDAVIIFLVGYLFIKIFR